MPLAYSDAVETFERGGGRTALFESLLALGLTAAQSGGTPRTGTSAWFW